MDDIILKDVNISMYVSDDREGLSYICSYDHGDKLKFIDIVDIRGKEIVGTIQIGIIYWNANQTYLERKPRVLYNTTYWSNKVRINK